MVPALQEMIQKLQDHSNIHFDFQHDFPDTIEVNIAISIYRIVQEALSNIVKHAKASKVTIRLGKEKKNYILFIQDNGVGSKELVQFHLNSDMEHKSQPTGIGLKNILSRTKMIEGTIFIDSILNEGTTLKIIF